jgi:hypothetical protein
MADERKRQDEVQDPQELSEEQLDLIAGGYDSAQIDVLDPSNDEKRNVANIKWTPGKVQVASPLGH